MRGRTSQRCVLTELTCSATWTCATLRLHARACVSRRVCNRVRARPITHVQRSYSEIQCSPHALLECPQWWHERACPAMLTCYSLSGLRLSTHSQDVNIARDGREYSYGADEVCLHAWACQTLASQACCIARHDHCTSGLSSRHPYQLPIIQISDAHGAVTCIVERAFCMQRQAPQAIALHISQMP